MSQDAIERAIKAVRKQGVQASTRIEIDPISGTITLVPVEAMPATPRGKVEWEEDFDAA